MAWQLIYTASQRCNYFFNTHMRLLAVRKRRGGGVGRGFQRFAATRVIVRSNSNGCISVDSIWPLSLSLSSGSSGVVLQLINWQ